MPSREPIVPGCIPVSNSNARHLRLRICCWTILLALGAAQAWVVRFVMNPDGISYLDMGDAYWRADWQHAINPYWSPLYSWIVGFFIAVFKPSPYWEYPLVHAVNFLIYVGSLVCFEFFLSTFLAIYRQQKQAGTELGIREPLWWLLGYALFACSSLALIGLYRVCPDMCVAGLCYLALALLLQIIKGGAVRSTYMAFGMVLGLAYLAKAVMFPLAFVFLACALIAKLRVRAKLQEVILSAAIFLVIAAPLCTAISLREHHLTFGDSGSWNYAYYINGMTYWTPDSPRWNHPLHQIAASPPIYEFEEPVGGTFPPWYNPVYWHQGFKPYLAVHADLHVVWHSMRTYAQILLLFFLSASVGAFALYLASGGFWASIRRSAYYWPVALPCLATLLLYAPVHVEGRFIAAQATSLLLLLYAGFRSGRAQPITRLVPAIVSAVAIISFLTVVVAPKVHPPVSMFVYAYPRRVPGPAYVEAADALKRSGVQPNDRIATVWKYGWTYGAEAYVPRLLRARVVADVVDADQFWMNPETRAQAIELLKRRGVRVIVTQQVPPANQQGWSRLANTDFFAYFLFPSTNGGNSSVEAKPTS